MKTLGPINDYHDILIVYSNIVKRIIAQFIDISIYIVSIIGVTHLFQTFLKIKLIPEQQLISPHKLLSLSGIMKIFTNNGKSEFNIENLFNLFTTDQLVFYLSAGFIIWITIIVLPEYLTNQSIGKMFLRIRVVDMDNVNISFIKSLFRESFGKFITLISVVGIILPAFKKRGQSIHDIIFKTYVVDMPD